MKKLVVITGASSGIGADLAKTFEKNGHPILLLSRRLEPMQALNLPNALCKSVDVTDYAGMEAAFKEAEAQFGPTDLLINCAGLMLLGNVPGQSYEEWNTMIEVNIKGILTGTHLVLPAMVTRNEGTIINISSIAGLKTFPQHSVYCGTKFAVQAITEGLRKEVAGSNVRITVIAPGVVETPLLSHTTDEGIIAGYNEFKKIMDGGIDAAKISACAQFIYDMPQDVCIREIVIAKTRQPD